MAENHGDAPVPVYSTQPEYHAPNPVNPPAEHGIAYVGQQGPDVMQPAPAPPAPPAAPEKAYPGQPVPNQFQQPTQYYQPAVHPSGYATATPLHALRSGPAPVDCPCCGQREMTRVEPVSGSTTHGWAAVLCLCCCLGCIPYLMSSLKDVNHYCGKCGAFLAVWHNSGGVEVIQQGRRG